LRGAKNVEAVVAYTTITPTGAFDGYKKAKTENGSAIVHLRIPKNAKRSNATGRKCRAEHVEVLAVFDMDDNEIDSAFTNFYGPLTEYKKGKIVRCDKWDDDRWNECSGGIHFFLTLYEAKEY